MKILYIISVLCKILWLMQLISDKKMQIQCTSSIFIPVFFFNTPKNMLLGNFWCQKKKIKKKNPKKIWKNLGTSLMIYHLKPLDWSWPWWFCIIYSLNFHSVIHLTNECLLHVKTLLDMVVKEDMVVKLFCPLRAFILVEERH